jgi:chitin-binding protein
VAGVNGRDRQVIPDGRLCSGNLPAYRGLDVARPDWPATRLTPGGRLTMTYASTIAHTGTFRLYLTRPGYDPAKPLKWSDLPERPFAEVTDPPLTKGAYHITATLPKDRTGRQMLYTIWQNSSTTDTYYSCSDVVFSGAAQATGDSKQARGGTKTPDTKAPDAEARGTKAPDAKTPHANAPGTETPRTKTPATPGDSTPVAEATRTDTGPSAPLLAGGAAAVLVLTGGAALVLRLRRR